MSRDPKIELIIDELISRLRVKYGRILIQRGFFDEEVTTFPSIYIFEDEELSEKSPTRRRGQYERTARVMLSYFLKGPQDLNGLYEFANRKRFELEDTIETDETFGNLCVDYSMKEFLKVHHKTNVLQLAVTYEFVYTEFAPWADPNKQGRS